MKKLYFLWVLFFFIPMSGQTAIDSIKVANDTLLIQNVHFEKNFKEKYKDNAFVYKELPLEESIWDRFLEWLKQLLNHYFDVQDGEKAKNIIDYTINTIAVILILLVIYLIVKAILNKEGTWIFSSSDKNIIRYDTIEKNIHSVDFQKLITKSIASGEHRLAIRYYYLWLLKKMSEKQIIQWDAEKTNTDYIYEIKSPQLKAHFEYLSYLYNYMWYGEFDLTLEDFEKAKKAFDQTLQSIY